MQPGVAQGVSLAHRALHQDPDVLDTGEVAVVGHQRMGVDLERGGELDCVGEPEPVAMPQAGGLDRDRGA